LLHAPDAQPALKAAADVTTCIPSIPSEIAAAARSYADALLAAVAVGRLSRWSDQDFGCGAVEARQYAAIGRNKARQAALAMGPRWPASVRSRPAPLRAGFQARRQAVKRARHHIASH
jgi:hypothetical protein